ncbi:hypothetical protein [Aquabacterium sp.]|uniref:hypothetical protein n=1 Tax=Aquabacterium sp. TaxID=1872578 RepID=UPI0035AF2D13
MSQNSWMRPSLADGWTSPSLEDSSASPVAAPRARVALGAASPGALDGLGGRAGRAVALGDGGAARAKAAPAKPAVAARAGNAPLHSAGPRARPRLFEFIGHGALSVTSSITGRHYRFTGHGAQLAVDPRDWSQLSRVPSLRVVVV